MLLLTLLTAASTMGTIVMSEVFVRLSKYGTANYCDIAHDDKSSGAGVALFLITIIAISIYLFL